MGKIIGSFRTGIIIISSILLSSCIADKVAIPEQYKNFVITNNRSSNNQLITSKLENAQYPINLLSYNVDYNLGKDTLILSYFTVQKNKSLAPIAFKNKTKSKFVYSLMPHYSEGNLVAKSFNIDGKYFLLIRGENPFCNGSNCQSYYLHFLEISENTILQNEVYEFNQSDVEFQNFTLKLIGNNLILSNNRKTLDIIKIGNVPATLSVQK